MSAAAPHPPPPSSLVPTITPACLSTLAIYNPSLGQTDETLPDQIVFFTSSRSSQDGPQNEKLRQIGLAQGVVEFARGFSNTDSCTSVETARSRVVTLEIESPGWWLLAQISLTHVHDPTTKPPTDEYSARDLAPTTVLVAQLRRAYRQFRFRYGTFEQCLKSMSRHAFCRRLEKYWHRWAWTRWDVLMHGSPAVDVFGVSGMKMAGGRPGLEMTSEEKEFLSGWVQSRESKGLVDMVVSRFGNKLEDEEEKAKDDGKWDGSIGGASWLWPGGKKEVTAPGRTRRTEVTPTDGCVFQGVGALKVQSVVDVATFVAELYEHGDTTAKKESKAERRKRTRRRPKLIARLSDGGVSSAEPSPRHSSTAVPTLTSAHQRSVSAASQASMKTVDPDPEESRIDAHTPLTEVDPLPEMADDPAPLETSAPEGQPAKSGIAGIAGIAGVPGMPAITNYVYNNTKIMNLLSFGWSMNGLTARATTAGESPDSSSATETESAPEIPSTMNKSEEPYRARFLIGFQGDLDAEDLDDDDSESGRITSRTIWISIRKPGPIRVEDQDQQENPQENPPQLEEYRLVVYINNPLVFAFIFKPDSSDLTSPSFYRTIHHQLSPLAHAVLSASSPASRSLKHITAAVAPKPPFDLAVHDATSAVYSTIPLIPDIGTETSERWTRSDAIHVYNLIVRVLEEKKKDPELREASVRSTRGWWVNWVKVHGGCGVVVRRSGEKKDALEGAGDTRVYIQGLLRAAP